MPAREIVSKVNPVLALNPFIASADGTTNGTTIDMRGYDSLLFVATAGTVTDGTITINIQHGDQSDASDMADCTAAQLKGTEPAFDSGDDDNIKVVGYIGGKRYVRCQAVVASSSTGANHVVVMALQGHSVFEPTDG